MLLSVVIPVVHVVACVFLIVVVLLQTGKGADMGAVFGGGGSQTLFGATGAGNLLTKLTTAMAVTFMCTSLTLAVSHQGRRGSDLLERLPDVAPVAVPPPPAPDAPPLTQPPPAAGEATDAIAPADVGTNEDAAASEPSDVAPTDPTAADADVADTPADPAPGAPAADGAEPTP